MARIPFPAHDTAAEVRAHHPLFEWAREQAAAAKEIDAKLAAAREKHDRTVTVLHESLEFRDVARRCRVTPAASHHAAIVLDAHRADALGITHAPWEIA